MNKPLYASCLAVLLCACASPPLQYSGVIVAGYDNPRYVEKPTHAVPLKDWVSVVTHVRWDETDRGGGLHQVRWKWYEGETLIAERSKLLDFKKTPYRFWGSLPASDLGIGHYRVEVTVDSQRVDEQAFEIVAR